MRRGLAGAALARALRHRLRAGRGARRPPRRLRRLARRRAPPEPYLYVAPWNEPPRGPGWTATGFRGAELGYAALTAAPDPRAAALAFFRGRRARCSSRPDAEAPAHRRWPARRGGALCDDAAMLRLSALVASALFAPRRASATRPRDGRRRRRRDGRRARRRDSAGGVRLVRVGSFDNPLYVTAPPGDRRRVMVVEQGGVIRVLRGGKRLSRPFLDISSRVTAGGEQGLLGLAFAPDYASSGRFYVYYTDRDASSASSSTGARAPTARTPRSARTVLVMDDPESNHNGGDIAFGPDGLLYIGTGDGGGAGDEHGCARERTEPRLAARQAAADRPAAPAAAAPTGSRRRTRSPGAAGRAARSTPTACATPGASRSTARPATSRSPTSGRARSRRSTSAAAAARAG